MSTGVPSLHPVIRCSVIKIKSKNKMTAFSGRICFICSEKYSSELVKDNSSGSSSGPLKPPEVVPNSKKIVTSKMNFCSLFKLSNFDDFNEFSNDEESGFCPACWRKYGAFSDCNVEERKGELRTEIYRILEKRQSSVDNDPIKRFIFERWSSLSQDSSKNAETLMGGGRASNIVVPEAVVEPEAAEDNVPEDEGLSNPQKGSISAINELNKLEESAQTTKGSQEIQMGSLEVSQLNPNQNLPNKESQKQSEPSQVQTSPKIELLPSSLSVLRMPRFVLNIPTSPQMIISNQFSKNCDFERLKQAKIENNLAEKTYFESGNQSGIQAISKKLKLNKFIPSQIRSSIAMRVKLRNTLTRSSIQNKDPEVEQNIITNEDEASKSISSDDEPGSPQPSCSQRLISVLPDKKLFELPASQATNTPSNKPDLAIKPLLSPQDIKQIQESQFKKKPERQKITFRSRSRSREKEGRRRTPPRSSRTRRNSRAENTVRSPPKRRSRDARRTPPRRDSRRRARSKDSSPRRRHSEESSTRSRESRRKDRVESGDCSRRSRESGRTRTRSRSRERRNSRTETDTIRILRRAEYELERDRDLHHTLDADLLKSEANASRKVRVISQKDSGIRPTLKGDKSRTRSGSPLAPLIVQIANPEVSSSEGEIVSDYSCPSSPEIIEIIPPSTSIPIASTSGSNKIQDLPPQKKRIPPPPPKIFISTSTRFQIDVMNIIFGNIPFNMSETLSVTVNHRCICFTLKSPETKEKSFPLESIFYFKVGTLQNPHQVTTIEILLRNEDFLSVKQMVESFCRAIPCILNPGEHLLRLECQRILEEKDLLYLRRMLDGRLQVGDVNAGYEHQSWEIHRTQRLPIDNPQHFDPRPPLFLPECPRPPMPYPQGGPPQWYSGPPITHPNSPIHWESNMLPPHPQFMNARLPLQDPPRAALRPPCVVPLQGLPRPSPSTSPVVIINRNSAQIPPIPNQVQRPLLPSHLRFPTSNSPPIPRDSRLPVPNIRHMHCNFFEDYPGQF